MSQEKLYEKAKKAIMDIYEDRETETEEVIINLKTLLSEIENLIISIQ